MRVRFYCDVWTGNDITKYALFASTSPVQKAEGATRIAFNVDIPDQILFGNVITMEAHPIEVEETK